MPVIVKTRGAKASNTAKKPATKPAAKRKPATKTTAKKAVKRSGTAQSSTPVRKKGVATPADQRTNRSPLVPEGMNKTELNSYLKKLTTVGNKREELFENWKEQVSESNQLIVLALNAEVPVGMIVDAANVTRQHVYKMLGEIRDGKRNEDGTLKNTDNRGGRPASKPATKRKPAAKKAPASSNGKKTIGTRKPAAKPAAGKRVSIRTRS